MAMQRVKVADAISKREFLSRLRAWERDTQEDAICDPTLPGITPRLFIRDGTSTFRLHSDTKRAGVVAYLALADHCSGGLEWHVVANKNGKMNAVAYGPEKKKVRGFYLYLHDQG